jgi:hypothetical protein
MGPWVKALETLAAGEAPVIRVSNSMFVPPAKKKPGRKKLVTPEKNPFHLYASAALLGGLTRPRCINPRCSERLRAGDEAACSEDCRLAAISFFEYALSVLKKEPLPVPPAPKEVPHARELPPPISGRVMFQRIPDHLRKRIAKGRGRKPGSAGKGPGPG